MAGVQFTPTDEKVVNGSKCCLQRPNNIGSPHENGSAVLSKSKKKRLRKKKKADEQVNKDKQKPPDESGDIQKIVWSNDKDRKPLKKVAVVPILDKSNQELPKIQTSIVNNISKNTDKLKQVDSSRKQPESLKEVAETAVRQDVGLEISSVKTDNLLGEKVGVVGDSESNKSNFTMDRASREDIMAQREAKKLAKLAKKDKSGTGGTPTQSKPIKKNDESTTPKTGTPETNIAKAQNSITPVAVKMPQQHVNQIAIDSPDSGGQQPLASSIKNADPVAVAAPTQLNNKEPLEPTQAAGKPDKTREEIIAEREAKKQAKLAAKNKKKEGGVVSTPSPAPAKISSEAPGTAELSGSGVQVESNGLLKDIPAAGEKSKAELRAERRAKQEAQRAAKKELDKDKPTSSTPKLESLSKDKTAPESKSQNKSPSQPLKASLKSTSYQPKLLSHLQMDTRPLSAHIYQNVHPAIVELGAKYAARVVSGSNARCIALLQSLKKVIVDFVTPREKEFSRAMETRLNDSLAYLNTCRKSSVSMTNALKHVKSHLTQLSAEKTTEDEARRKLCDVIDTFIKEQIDVAGEAICNAVAKKISNGDTIAIYGCSSLLLRILVESHNEGKDFEVVVVDGGPLFEGTEMCRRLVSENIKCTYVLLPAFSYIVGQTDKVLLGAHALLANGCVMSRSGTALVAMVAKSHNVPVIVCCETYKFCERVQADAFFHNELGPQDGCTPPSISLMYDMTPPTLVDAVATELAILPCTSVPVILRVKPSDVSSYYY